MNGGLKSLCRDSWGLLIDTAQTWLPCRGKIACAYTSCITENKNLAGDSAQW